MIQTWSNMLHLNEDLFMNYDLVIYLALAMNTKVVHNDTLNMFRLIARSPNHLHVSTHDHLHIYTRKHEMIRNVAYVSIKCFKCKCSYMNA